MPDMYSLQNPYDDHLTDSNGIILNDLNFSALFIIGVTYGNATDGPISVECWNSCGAIPFGFYAWCN